MSIENVSDAKLKAAIAAKKEGDVLSDDVVDDNEWKEGDFELISADRVRFRCPGVHLFSSSVVFRTAHSLDQAGEKKMTFTERDIESAAVIRLYLNLAAAGSLGTIRSSLPNVKELVLFLIKWECDGSLATLLIELELLCWRKSAFAFDLFMVAANADAKELAALAIEASVTHSWTARAGEVVKPLKGTPGQNIWNSSHWPSYIWTSGVPPRYLFAVARAWGEEGGKDNNKGLPKAFRKYLEAMT